MGARLIRRPRPTPQKEKGQVYVDPTELDSHADTIVAGRNTLLMSYTDRVCEVSPYSDEYQPKKDVPIVSAATGYTSACGENYILILNEALWMPNLNHSLLSTISFYQSL